MSSKNLKKGSKLILKRASGNWGKNPLYLCFLLGKKYAFIIFSVIIHNNRSETTLLIFSDDKSHIYI